MMRYALALASAVVCLSVTHNPAFAGSPDNGKWEEVRSANQRDDVTVWNQKVEGNDFKAFKGQIEVHYPMLSVFAVLTDIDTFPDWMYQTVEAFPLPQLGDDIAYVKSRAIWPVKARDAVGETSISQDPATLAIRIHTVGKADLYPQQPGAVRIPSLDNAFTLEPQADGWTRITFETFVDPGGQLPAWLVNLVTVQAPTETLEGVKSQLDSGRYMLDSPDTLVGRLPGIASLQFPPAP